MTPEERKEELHMIEIDAIAISNISNILHDIQHDLDGIEYDRKMYHTLNDLERGLYVSSLGRAVKALAEGIMERATHLYCTT